ncbi:MAG: flavin reductase family protein [Candidatus Diapherotrites archaeon]|nr:flavin reductase family protein [Candidatus Diapherotrites archaeon]
MIYPRVTVLVTSAGLDRKPNAAPYSWIAPVSFSPPMLYLGIQKRETQTVKNIRATGEFVVNVVTKDWAAQAVACEAKIPDKVERSGLRFRESKKVKAPTAEKAEIALECKLHEIIETGKADHYLVIGEIVHAEKDEKIKNSEIVMHLLGADFISPGKKFTLERKK